MTHCQCCRTPVWVMYAPAMCDDCIAASCRPVIHMSDEYDAFLSRLAMATRLAPCKRTEPKDPPDVT